MALYEYRSKHGKKLMVEAPMTDAPPVGHTLRKGGVVYRRQAATGLKVNVVGAGRRTANIRAWSLPTKDQMEPELQAHVDAFDANGVACFSSVESAKRFSGFTRDRVEKTGQGQFYDYGDGPSGIEVDAANKKRKRIKFDR